MKILSLNTWGGKEFPELVEYILKHKDADIFCFQEVFSSSLNSVSNKKYCANLFEKLQDLLPNHEGYFAAAQNYKGVEGVDFDHDLGIAIFIRKSIRIKEIGDFFIRGSRNSRKDDDYLNTIPYNLQYVVLDLKGKSYTIVHFHGLWNGGGKADTEERIEQSKKIKNFTDNVKEKLVVCGDFNLLPNTQSLTMLEENLTNLIKKYGVMSTRSKLYAKPEKFADYTLVSKDIEVKSFEVPYTEASDHLPMILEFY